MAIYLIFYIHIPAQKVKENEREMLRLVADLNDRSSLETCDQINQFTIQVHNQPLKLTLFGVIDLDIASLSYLLGQTALWFFTLMQFELDSFIEKPLINPYLDV